MSVAADTPLVLVHGFAQTPKSWQTTIECLGDARPLHAIELPGHGATALTRGEPSVENVRAQLLADVDAVVPPVALWGYSQGSRVALDFALAHPDRVAALILESGTAGIDDPLARADRRSRDFALASRIENQSIEEFVQLWEMVPALTDQSRELIEAQRADRLSHDLAALAAALRGIGQAAYEPMWSRLPELRVSVLTISGERDKIYTANAERITAAVPQAEHVTVAGAGHSVHLERPAEVAEIVAGFLAEQRSEGRR
ncbi:MAG: alpha/beta fold hydrolase [Actinobacteria bacterium]|nr:alpha/beta fold hydrolase [Actinomycetota bacterium]